MIEELFSAGRFSEAEAKLYKIEKAGRESFWLLASKVVFLALFCITNGIFSQLFNTKFEPEEPAQPV